MSPMPGFEGAKASVQEAGTRAPITDRHCPETAQAQQQTWKRDASLVNSLFDEASGPLTSLASERRSTGAPAAAAAAATRLERFERRTGVQKRQICQKLREMASWETKSAHLAYNERSQDVGQPIFHFRGRESGHGAQVARRRHGRAGIRSSTESDNETRAPRDAAAAAVCAAPAALKCHC